MSLVTCIPKTNANILLKHLCFRIIRTPSTQCYHYYHISRIRKQLGDIILSNYSLQIKKNVFIRSFIWSHVLSTSGTNRNKTEPQNIKASELKPKQEEKNKDVMYSNQSVDNSSGKPIIDPKNVLSPLELINSKNYMEQSSSVVEKKIPSEKNKDILENIKEQSLENPKDKIKTKLSSEPLQKLKEKILVLKKDDTKTAKVETVKPPIKKRKRVDLTASSLERNFITPVKAMSDFLLKPSDLESLPKTKRRSPYECEPPITVYWRKDVEAKSLEVWGSKENLVLELLKRDIERRKYQQNIFTVKRRLRDYRRELGRTPDMVQAEEGLMGRSGKVVLTAVAINATNCLFKLFAWIYTGSHSMFAESIHSLADTINQLILAYGIHKSIQIADSYHPYGYSNMKYVASLISGVGIFCVGTGLSFYHGTLGLIDPQPIEDFYWAYFILGGSLVSEGATCLVALNSVRKGAKSSNMSVRDYITRGQDPSVNVVLLEDFAAVIGVIVAASCMGISSVTHSPIADSVGSLLVGCILGSVASFIIYTNVAALVGRSIPQENLDKINAVLEADVMIRAIHDVKGIDMGNFLIRYKAELDFDGKELARMYLDKVELNVLLEEVKKFENIDQLEEFMLKHGESIVDMIGGEIDRIEMKLRKKHPEIRHCDLEIL